MPNDPQSLVTFIVRVWREPSDENAIIWRGSVERVQTGERAYFQSMEKLIDAIFHTLGEELRARKDVPDIGL